MFMREYADKGNFNVWNNEWVVISVKAQTQGWTSAKINEKNDSIRKEITDKKHRAQMNDTTVYLTQSQTHELIVVIGAEYEDKTGIIASDDIISQYAHTGFKFYVCGQ